MADHAFYSSHGSPTHRDGQGIRRRVSAEHRPLPGPALTRPVAVARNGRERTVMISIEEYRRLKRRDRQMLSLDDFTDADIAVVEATGAPVSAKAFDHELK